MQTSFWRNMGMGRVALALLTLGACKPRENGPSA